MATPPHTSLLECIMRSAPPASEPHNTRQRELLADLLRLDSSEDHLRLFTHASSEAVVQHLQAQPLAGYHLNRLCEAASQHSPMSFLSTQEASTMIGLQARLRRYLQKQITQQPFAAD